MTYATPPAPGDKPKPEFHPVQPGSYSTAAVILLTDGQTNAGYDPVEAARMAGEYGVRVYTVGFGTTKGNIVGRVFIRIWPFTRFGFM